MPFDFGKLPVHLIIEKRYDSFRNPSRKKTVSQSIYLDIFKRYWPTASFYSTVTDFARLRGWSTLQPLIKAI